MGTAHNYGYTLRSFASLRCSGPRTLRKRLISFAFLLRADARNFGRSYARTASCLTKSASGGLRIS